MFAKTLTLLQNVKSDKKGVTALEYGVIASVIVGVLLIAFQAFYAQFALLLAGVGAGL